MTDINPNNNRKKEVVGIKVIDLINLSIKEKRNIYSGTPQNMTIVTPSGIFGMINILSEKA